MLGGFNPILLLPKRQKPQRRCPRCGLLFDKDQAKCPHCSDLNDQQVAELQQEMAERAEANRNLGWSFAVIAVAIGVVLLLFAL